MAESSANAIQNVNPGEAMVFTETPVPCRRGFVRHRDGTGNFMLSGWTPGRRCRCSRNATYLVEFGANIAIPEGETVGPISMAIQLGGATVPATTMIVTPAAANEFFNISCAVNVEVWGDCCENLSVCNTSDQAIQVQNANIIFSRPDLAITY